MSRFLGLCRVLLHYVVVHECLGAEEGEAAWRAHDTPDHVFGCLLEPMADCVLEQLVPDHRAGAHRVDTTAGGAKHLE